jgi:hypothetical protein
MYDDPVVQKEYDKNYYRTNREKRLLQTREWRRKNPDKVFAHRLKQYGITIDQYETMLSEQEGLCFICRGVNRDGRRLFVDHCHKTGKVRRLLCHFCNVMIGRIEMYPEGTLIFLREAGLL